MLQIANGMMRKRRDILGLCPTRGPGSGKFIDRAQLFAIIIVHKICKITFRRKVENLLRKT